MKMREGGGASSSNAQELYRQAADRGSTVSLWELVRMREQAEDSAGARELYQQAADRGSTVAWLDLEGPAHRLTIDVCHMAITGGRCDLGPA